MSVGTWISSYRYVRNKRFIYLVGNHCFIELKCFICLLKTRCSTIDTSRKHVRTIVSALSKRKKKAAEEFYFTRRLNLKCHLSIN